MRLTTRDKMALARAVQRPVLAVRRARGRGQVAQVRRRGVRWELDLREGIDFSVWLTGSFEAATVAAYRREVRPGAVVLDIGANVGAHTLLLADAVGPGGRVVAYEPTASAFERLRTNVTLNPELAPRVLLHQVMLLGTADAPLPSEVVSSWPLLPRRELDAVAPGLHQGTEGATATTLDASLADDGVGAIDLVKLDVDGYECDVLDGGEETLRAHHPTVLFELAPAHTEATTARVAEELVDRFRALGYRMWNLRGTREVRAGDVEELRRQRASMNVVARWS